MLKQASNKVKDPTNRLMCDIALAQMAAKTQTTEVLNTFPAIPAVQEAGKEKARTGLH